MRAQEKRRKNSSFLDFPTIDFNFGASDIPPLMEVACIATIKEDEKQFMD
jgi:hypothetical protein